MGLPSEPAAAYLEEVLHQLGHELGDKKPLYEWLALYAEGDAFENMQVADLLVQACREDALALPMTWLFINRGQAFDADKAAEELGIDLSTPIDRGQWASWLFYEALLHLRLRDSANAEV